MIDSVIETKSITDSSHECHNNSLFFMINGNNDNGENYFIDAYNKGCRHFVIDETSMFETNLNVFIYKVNDILEYYNNLLLKQNAEIFKKIKIIGVTGTNGKTTTTTLTYQVLKKYYNVILIGTNGTFVCYKKKEYHLNTINTTPKLSTIIKILNDYPHTEVIILEVSSEAILYKRIGNLLFDIIGLTNIGHDHLNSHKTINNYLECKKSLLKKFKNNKGVFIVNNDDKYRDYFLKDLNYKYFTYGISLSMLTGEVLELKKDYMMVKVMDKYHEVTFGTNILGKFNLYNILLTISICLQLNIDFMKIIETFEKRIEIIGRYQVLEVFNRKVYIDYAHNPEAVKEFLTLVNQVEDNKIICVIGAGGNKDRSKRHLMGYYAHLYSDLLIFTEDTSRGEAVNEIIADLCLDLQEDDYLIELNRVDAVKKAFLMSDPADIIVLLGMGNDLYYDNLTDYLVVKKLEEHLVISNK